MQNLIEDLKQKSGDRWPELRELLAECGQLIQFKGAGVYAALPIASIWEPIEDWPDACLDIGRRLLREMGDGEGELLALCIELSDTSTAEESPALPGRVGRGLGRTTTRTLVDDLKQRAGARWPGLRDLLAECGRSYQSEDAGVYATMPLAEIWDPTNGWPEELHGLLFSLLREIEAGEGELLALCIELSDTSTVEESPTLPGRVG